MKLIFFILLSFFTKPIFAQTEVSLKEVSKHIGETVSIGGTVTDTRYIPEKEVTLLNIGGKYPNQQLTIVIRGDDRLKFKDPPEEIFKGREIIIIGKVELYNGKPQIIVTEKAQIIISFKG